MMKRKLIALLLTLSLIFTGYGFNTLTVSAARTKPVVSISQTQLSLLKGESSALAVKISPASLAKKALISWKTSNRRVATVSAKGNVKAIREGSVTVTVTVKIEGKTYKGVCKVTVIKPVTKITLNAKSKSLYIDNTYQIKVKVTPTSATNKKVTYTSSDSSVATVSSTGLVKAIKVGKATITVKAKDGSGVSAKLKIVVKEKNLNIGSRNIIDGSYTLSNKVYDNITIDNSIKTATVNLNNITVRGTLTLTDGAAYKVKVKDCNINKVVFTPAVKAMEDTASASNQPTLDIDGNTIIQIIIFLSNGTLSGQTTGTIGDVTISANVHALIKMVLQKLTLENAASGSTIQIDGQIVDVTSFANNLTLLLAKLSLINKLTLNGNNGTVSGEGSVDSAFINGNNNQFNLPAGELITGANTTGTTMNGTPIAPGTTVKPGGGGGGGTTTTVTISGCKSGDTVSYVLPVSYTCLSKVVVTYKGTSYTVDGTILSLLRNFLANETYTMNLWKSTTDFCDVFSGQKVKVTGDKGYTKTVSFEGGSLDGKKFTVTVNTNGTVTVNSFTISKECTTTLKIKGNFTEVPIFTVTY